MPEVTAGAVPSVLMLTDNLKVGGVQKVVVELTNALTSGRKARVAVAAEKGGALDQKLLDAVVYHDLPSRRSLIGKIRFVRWMRELVGEQGFDIVHSHQREVSLLARIATLGLRTKVVEHVHNTFPPGRDRPVSFRGDRLVACGSSIARMLAEEYGRPISRISVARNGVPLPSGSRESSGFTEPERPDAIQILAVGRCTEQKDPLTFVRLLAALNESGTVVEGTWVGDGPLLGAARSLAQQTPSARVQFVGGTTEPAEYFVRSDVLMLTSRWEGLPLVILEAMAMARAVIVPSVGSCADPVQQGVSGHVYDPRMAIVDIAAELSPLLDRRRLAEWGRAGRLEYEREYTLDAFADRVLAIYLETAA